MDRDAYLRCLAHLQVAEQCMVEPLDGWHLARLGMVVDRLKEAYEPGPLPVTVAKLGRGDD